MRTTRAAAHDRGRVLNRIATRHRVQRAKMPLERAAGVYAYMNAQNKPGRHTRQYIKVDTQAAPWMQGKVDTARRDDPEQTVDMFKLSRSDPCKAGHPETQKGTAKSTFCTLTRENENTVLRLKKGG